MALDSFAKRVSATGVGRPWMRSTSPNAPMSQSWRQAVGNIYSGNLVGAGASDTEIAQARSTFRFVHSRVHGRVN